MVALPAVLGPLQKMCSLGTTGHEKVVEQGEGGGGGERAESTGSRKGLVTTRNDP
jgi:hypothetical protein